MSDATREIARTKARILDIPLLTSNDALTCESGAYLVVTPEGLDTTKEWFGGTLYKSEDGTNFNIFKTFSKKSLFGIVTSLIAEGNTEIPDEDNVITVEITDGTLTLESISEEEFMVGKNLCLCGNELLQFMTAELIDDNIYELSTLLRGRYGTEWAMYEHEIDEEFTLLNPGMAHRFPIETYEINSTKAYATVTDGLVLDDNSEIILFTYTGQCLIPYAPCQSQISKEENGDWTISWVGRPRYPTEFKNYGYSQCYRLDIYNFDYSYSSDQIVRTIYLHITQTDTNESSNPVYIYKYNDQITDFDDEQIILVTKVCQISPIVGEGQSITIANLDDIESIDHIKSYASLTQVEYTPVKKIDAYQNVVQIEYSVDTAQLRTFQSLLQAEYKSESSKLKTFQHLTQVEYYVTPSLLQGYQTIVQVEYQAENSIFANQSILQIEYT